MGFDISLSGHEDTIYFTYNHAHLLMAYNIHPRQFNGKPVAEIMPRIQRAITALKKRSDVEILQRWKDEAFMREIGALLWKPVSTAVCIACMHALETLEAAPPDAIWQLK